MSRDEDALFLALSRIHHFYYCKRRWGLIELEQQWADNSFTAEGQVIHENADDPFFREKREDLIITRAVPVQSQQLRLAGVCDVVEWQRQAAGDIGVQLDGYEGLWWPLVVEYKRGKRKQELSDEVQLCAQSMALEEMLGITLFEGALFYHQERRRVSVMLTETLREETRKTAEEMYQIYASGKTPVVKEMKRCRYCSLKDLCMPRMVARKKDVHAYIARALAGDDE